MDYTIRTAAQRLHVTPQTIRHRLARAELAGTKVPGKYGPEWRVSLERGSALANRSHAELLAVIAWQNAVIVELRQFLGIVLTDLLREADGSDGVSASDYLGDVRVVAPIGT